MPQDKIPQLLASLHSGNELILAKAISMVENHAEGYQELLAGMTGTATSKVVGITGPPGAGKSTLVNALLQYWTGKGKKLAVIAVDPSSPFNYGALLGDRIRMSRFYTDPNVFIRSLASRGALGGLSNTIMEVTDVVKHAGFDLVLVETVGVGQSEVEVAGLADCTVLTLVPESGDMVQTIKAGIMEIADVFVVNKADREGSEAAWQSLKGMVHEKGLDTPVIKTIAGDGTGIEELAMAIEDQLAHPSAHPKKISLLAEKLWNLVRDRRMQDIDKPALMMELAEAIKKPDFNLYTFAGKWTS